MVVLEQSSAGPSLLDATMLPAVAIMAAGHAHLDELFHGQRAAGPTAEVVNESDAGALQRDDGAAAGDARHHAPRRLLRGDEMPHAHCKIMDVAGVGSEEGVSLPRRSHIWGAARESTTTRHVCCGAGDLRPRQLRNVVKVQGKRKGGRDSADIVAR